MTSTPLDESALAGLVDRFYEKVRVDAQLGPVFNAAVHDWDQHKQLLTSFWASVALRAGSYRGNPMGAHRPHPIRDEHFDRWLQLWRETCGELLAEGPAEQMVEYAERIGSSLRYGLGVQAKARPLGVPLAVIRHG
ncbi:MAG: group III truncated hemoglobin [Pseudomonadota bacterium]|nr:group III truncated hemoglobin [Pseudomonadota bacterium]